MRTPLEQAFAQLHGQHPHYTQLTAKTAILLWMRLFAPSFFGLMLCCLIAIGCALLLLNTWHSNELRALLSFAGLLLFSFSYCLGNILLLQGIPGARMAYNILAATLLAIIAASMLWETPRSLFYCGLASSLSALLISSSRRFQALQRLHQLIRQLRLAQRPKRL